MKGYNSHLTFSELNKFDIKIDVIPNGLEKYMAFFLGRNLAFIDSMQFMNSSLDEDFKYLVEEFGSENIKLSKQKGAYPYEYMNNFENLMKKNYLQGNISLVQQKKENLIMMVKYQMVM